MTCLLPEWSLESGWLCDSNSELCYRFYTDWLTVFPFGYQKDREPDFTSLFLTVTIKLQKWKKVQMKVLLNVIFLSSLFYVMNHKFDEPKSFAVKSWSACPRRESKSVQLKTRKKQHIAHGRLKGFLSRKIQVQIYFYPFQGTLQEESFHLTDM